MSVSCVVEDFVCIVHLWRERGQLFERQRDKKKGGLNTYQSELFVGLLSLRLGHSLRETVRMGLESPFAICLAN